MPDLDGAQIGEMQTGDTVGGNVYHGADSQALLEFVQEYVFLADQERRAHREEIRAELWRLRLEIWLLRLLLIAAGIAYLLEWRLGAFVPLLTGMLYLVWSFVLWP